MTDASPALAVSGLHKAFGDTPVLRGLDFSVSPGEFVAILGASGGGKTTLLRILCGFERADRGAVALAGVPVDVPHPDDRSADETGRRRHHVRPEHRRVGYVAQEGGLFPHLSVSANILFGLPRAGRADLVRAHALLDLVGLPHAYADRSPHSLSGGEQQRVALARALAPRPALVLLDEPFSALDAGSRAGTRQAVADALRESGATALLVTHDQGEALSMGNRIGVLRRGVLAQFATPDELYR
ncbi:MAG: ABC transporter ATP-binding protein, partial [Gluconacetobacter diazotrophicus]|nr:ABC transporter ATP-binding protein [Gluconacetobacter diazotrophicus]